MIQSKKSLSVSFSPDIASVCQTFPPLLFANSLVSFAVFNSISIPKGVIFFGNFLRISPDPQPMSRSFPELRSLLINFVPLSLLRILSLNQEYLFA